MLTDRQQEVLDFIRSFVATHGYPPTRREIGEGLAIRSPNGVMCHLEALRKKGAIDWQPLLARSIVVKERGANAGACQPSC